MRPSEALQHRRDAVSAAMRNRIAQGYLDLDIDLVWEVATEALPEFRSTLSAIGLAGADAREPLSVPEPRKDEPSHGQG